MYCLLCFWHSSHNLVHLNHMHSDGGVGSGGTKKKKKEVRERMNHSPSTAGKANDLSQPLLSLRLAERKLPAVPHTHTCD